MWVSDFVMCKYIYVYVQHQHYLKNQVYKPIFHQKAIPGHVFERDLDQFLWMM